MLGIRQGLEVKKIAARHVPGLSLDTGYPSEPSIMAFPMPQVHPTALRTTPCLPSHVDPSVFGLTSSTGQQEYLQPQSSSNYDYNANFNLDFSMGSGAFSDARESNPRGQAESLSQNIQTEDTGFQNPFLNVSYGQQPGAQGIIDNTPISNISGLPTNFSAPQATLWSQDHTSCHGSNVVGPSTFSFYNSEAQYRASSDGCDAGEPFEYNLEPKSVEDLLESELGAVSLRPT
jgi:hypothetical protein